jgi:predicted dehydrogenase
MTAARSAGHRHRVLVVGTGSIGERHLRCFLATGCAEAAIAEPNAVLRAAVAGRYPVAGAWASLDEGLAGHPGGRPDVVVICTPAHLHIPMARAAVAAGCHVLVEKPLSTSLDGVDELAREAAAGGRAVGLAYVYRAHPAIAAAREAIASGRFGEPVEVVAVSGQSFPFFRPAYREIYYNSRATGGGAIQDALTHVVNAVEWLVGPTRRLAADAAHQVLDGVEVEDTVHVLARLARPGGQGGDVMASFALNQHQAANENTFTIVCRRGVVRVEMHAMRWRWATEPSPQPGTEWHDEPVGPLERDDLFVRQAGAFLDAVEGRSPLLCPLADGVQSLRSMLAILRAADGGRWEEVDA